MLSSTRTTARSLVARASNSYAQALPAESSRQGLLRAIAQQQLAEQRQSVHRRRNGSTYSTAVAYAEDDRQDRLDEDVAGYWAERRAKRVDSRYPPLRSLDVQETVDGLERLEQDVEDRPHTGTKEESPSSLSTSDLVALISSDPAEALLALPRCRADTLSSLTPRHLVDLLKNIYKSSRKGSRALQMVHPAQAEQSLAVVRNLIHDLPSSPRANDTGLGKRFQGDLLGRFLRACVIFDSDYLLRDTLKERLGAEAACGERLVQPDMLVTALATRRRWDMLIDLFSPARFPISSYTPITIWRLMQAHLGSGRAYKLAEIHQLHADLGLTPLAQANALLVQSHLQLGDIDAARQVMRETISAGQTDNVAQQLAILRGYRSLGKDDELERKALQLAKGMEPAHEAAIVHALVRLRLDGNDIAGARSLMARFRLPAWATTTASPLNAESFGPELNAVAYLEGNDQTLQLAFRTLAPSLDLRRLETAWHDLASTLNSQSSLDDSTGTLIAALSRMGQLDLAWSTLTRSPSSPFSLPATYRPSVVPFNSLLLHASRAEGYAGLERALKLFRSADIKPNERTLQIVLDSVRTRTSGDPATLANLTNALLRQLPNVKPTVDHVDLLLSQAVHAQSRAARMAVEGRSAHLNDLTAPAESASDNARAGLKTNDQFKAAMKGIIQSLRDRGARSASRSLATRLRFDAHTGTGADGNTVPSAQAVWDDMLSRGFTPDKRHLLALMKGYADSGHMRECEDVILLAKDFGVEVTRGMWMVIMTGYGRRGLGPGGQAPPNVDRAEKAFQAIRRSREGLDPAAVCAMIGIYLRARRRPMAAQLALQLVASLVSPTDSAPSSVGEADIPFFPVDMLDDRVTAIATDALRLDHPHCALQVIACQYPTPTAVPSRVRQVVRSIRSRSRARIQHRIDSAVDHDVLMLAEQMLAAESSVTAGNKIKTARTLGPNGVKKRVLRLFERKKHNGRGSGGRKVISAKEERRIRHDTIHNARETLRTVEPVSPTS